MNVCIGEPRIFEVADVETKWFNHRLEAGNTELRANISEVDLIGAITVIADKEIRN